MESQIKGKVYKIIQNCVSFARKYMPLPENIEFYYDDCPSERFPTIYNAAEASNNRIYFNKLWVYKIIEDHQDDFEFFVFHELRHLYQRLQISKLELRQNYDEPLMVIRAWRNDFSDYVRNTDEASQTKNLKQTIEIDANAYAIVLVNLLYKNKKSINLSLPQEAQEVAFRVAIEHYKTKSEFAENHFAG